MKNMQAKFLISVSILSLLVVGGCEIPSTDEITPSATVGNVNTSKYDNFRPPVDAGIAVPAPTPDPAKMKDLVAMKSRMPRTDPFALLAVEKKYDNAQLAERLVADSGWRFDYVPPEPVITVEPEEPQPYRRLSGVLVGDTIMALLVMEDGHYELIRPGMKIPNTEWRVISIDEEKALLKRDGNRRPKQIVVRLETDPGGGGSTAPAGGGNPRGGNPGGPDAPNGPRGPRGGRPGDGDGDR